MKLKPYLDASPDCTVRGYCRACRANVKGKRIQHNPTQHAQYVCPRCSSVSLRIDEVIEIAADGTKILVYERQE